VNATIDTLVPAGSLRPSDQGRLDGEDFTVRSVRRQADRSATSFGSRCEATKYAVRTISAHCSSGVSRLTAQACIATNACDSRRRRATLARLKASASLASHQRAARMRPWATQTRLGAGRRRLAPNGCAGARADGTSSTPAPPDWPGAGGRASVARRLRDTGPYDVGTRDSTSVV